MTAEDILFVRELLGREAGIELEADKQYLIESRLLPLARQHGCPSLAALVASLRQSPGAPIQQQAVEALTTQETSFFRDVHPYEALRLTILPDLIARRQSARRLDIWCGAASTGQEPYSVAILLREHFPQLAGWQVRIIATDLSDGALQRARAGRFNPAEVARGLEASQLSRHFTQDASGWIIRDEIRRMVDFRRLNLMGSWAELPELDLLLLRNVLIYLRVPVKREILRRIHRQLRSDGYLLLGAAETTMHLENAFEVVHLDRTTCYRPGKASPLPSGSAEDRL